MTRTLTAILAGLLAVAALGACADDADPANTPTATSSAVAGSDGEPAPTTTTAAAPSSAVDAAALCAFLEQAVASLESVGSAVGALARFAGDYGTWVEGGPNRKLSSATELDAVTTSQCPAVRTQVLTALGVDSFSAALG